VPEWDTCQGPGAGHQHTDRPADRGVERAGCRRKESSSRTEVRAPSRASKCRWGEPFAPMERRACEGGDRSRQSEKDPLVGPEQFVPSQRGV
jgi:hypothetical protein